MSTSNNMIAYIYIWFEGWFKDMFEGGLKLSLKIGLINLTIVKVTILSGLKLGLKKGLINLEAFYVR